MIAAFHPADLARTIVWAMTVDMDGARNDAVAAIVAILCAGGGRSEGTGGNEAGGQEGE